MLPVLKSAGLNTTKGNWYIRTYHTPLPPMREFSVKEQSIIKNRLIDGATLPGLFSDHFLTNGKLMIHVDPNGHHKFEFLL